MPKTTGSAQTQKCMSFIWIVWSTLYVYLWQKEELTKQNARNAKLVNSAFQFLWKLKSVLKVAKSQKVFFR